MPLRSRRLRPSRPRRGRSSRRVLPLLAVGALLAARATALAAQAPPPTVATPTVATPTVAAPTVAAPFRAPDEREPPRLVPRDADPLDWEAWFDHGVKLLVSDPAGAERAFARSAQLRPDRAEPLLARWAAFHARDPERFVRYLDGDARTARDAAVQRADSARALAFWRNPFVHQGLMVAVLDKLPGGWREDHATRGWIALAQANLPKAAQLFGEAIRQAPERNGWLRFVRASALVNAGRADSAEAELTALLAARRRLDERRTVRQYESKALLEYALGLLHQQARRPDAAREAYGRAVVEDAAFAPAHARLGQLALAADVPVALLELGSATELAPDDPLFHRWHADALARAGQGADAIAALRRATALAPRWAEPHQRLAALLAAAGDAEGARAATAAWLERAPRADPARASAGR